MDLATLAQLAGGLAALIGGGELLVRGASGLARSLGLPAVVVGLTVVAFATSAPELAVTVHAAATGSPGLAVGNVVGSNIVNILLVLGASALILPLAVRSQLVRADIPVMIGLSVAALLLALDNSITRFDGVLLVVALVAYVAISIVVARRNKAQDADRRRPSSRRRPLPLDIGFVVVGVGLLVLGARWFVGGATDVAAAFGISDLVIGLTVVAIGTSLPEIATSIIAVTQGERDLAVGNVVGSNVFNLGLVLGLASVFSPDGVPVPSAAVHLDLPIMIAVALALAPVAFTQLAVARWEAGLFLAYYAAYVAYVLLDARGHDAVDPFSTVMLGFVIPITALWLALLVAYEVGLRRGRRQAVL